MPRSPRATIQRPATDAPAPSTPLGPLPHPRRGALAGYASLVVGILCIAWSGPLVVWAAVPGPASAFYRVLVAAVVLLPWRLLHPRPWPRGRPLAAAIAAGVFFALDLALFNSAILHSSASTATLLGNTAPVLVGLAARFIFHQRQPAAFWMGLAVALLGSATLVGADALHPERGAGHALGDAMALGSACFYASYLLTTGRTRSAMDTLTLTTIAVAASVVTLLIVCLALGVPLAGGSYDARTWAALVGLGLVSQLGGYLSITYALGHLPATVTSVALLAQAPLTALLAVPLLGERFTPFQLLGGILVLAGIGIVNVRARG